MNENNNDDKRHPDPAMSSSSGVYDQPTPPPSPLPASKDPPSRRVLPVPPNSKLYNVKVSTDSDNTALAFILPENYGNVKPPPGYVWIEWVGYYRETVRQDQVIDVINDNQCADGNRRSTRRTVVIKQEVKKEENNTKNNNSKKDKKNDNKKSNNNNNNKKKSDNKKKSEDNNDTDDIFNLTTDEEDEEVCQYNNNNNNTHNDIDDKFLNNSKRPPSASGPTCKEDVENDSISDVPSVIDALIEYMTGHADNDEFYPPQNQGGDPVEYLGEELQRMKQLGVDLTNPMQRKLLDEIFSTGQSMIGHIAEKQLNTTLCKIDGEETIPVWEDYKNIEVDQNSADGLQELLALDERLMRVLKGLGIKVDLLHGDGNCFYRGILQAFNADQGKHNELRQFVVKRIRMDIDRYREFWNVRDELMTFEQHLEEQISKLTFLTFYYAHIIFIMHYVSSNQQLTNIYLINIYFDYQLQHLELLLLILL